MCSDNFEKIVLHLKKKNDELKNKSGETLEYSFENDIFLYAAVPDKVLADYEEKSVSLKNILLEFKKYCEDNDSVNFINLSFLNIPRCILIENGFSKCLSFDYLGIDFPKYDLLNENSFLNYSSQLSMRVKSKCLRCDDCIYKEKCSGLYLNYIRLFDFSELVPIKKMDCEETL